MGQNVLLTADWHLTDSVLDEYRWGVFENTQQIALENRVSRIFILGDFVDRKDKHAASLLNRVVTKLRDLVSETGAPVTILMGNHDMPLKGTPYWDFLNTVGVQYVTDPVQVGGIWCLPFSPNPLEDWRGIPLHEGRAVFMHQTVEGSLVEGNRRIEKAPHPMPILPRGIPIFSGDIHRPQQIGGITYIGVPHPTRFSENWATRMLLVKNADFKHPVIVPTSTIKRAIVEVESISQLISQRFRPGDQIRVRFKLTPEALTSWAGKEDEIRRWAEHQGVVVASTEAIITKEVEQTTSENNPLPEFSLLNSKDVVKLFVDSEGLSPFVYEQGLALLREAMSA